MTYTSNTAEEKLKFAKKLDAAAKLLRSEFKTDKAIVKFIRTQGFPEFSEPWFNRLHKESFVKTKPAKVSSYTYISLFKKLDPYIAERFHCKWNGHDYISIEARLVGLIGTYECFVVDPGSSFEKKEDYIHFFKVNIESVTKGICETKADQFVISSISMLVENKAAIEIVSTTSARKIFIIILIGSGNVEKLQSTEKFFVMFLDGGDEMRCGIALMKRTDKEYKNMVPISLPSQEFQDALGDETIEALKKHTPYVLR